MTSTTFQMRQPRHREISGFDCGHKGRKADSHVSFLQLTNSAIHRILPGRTSLLGRGDHTILERDEQDTLFGWFLKYTEMKKQFAPGKLTVYGTCSNLPLIKPPLLLSKNPSCLQHQSLNFSPPRNRQSQINMHARGTFLDSET